MYKPGDKLVLEIKNCEETNIRREERIYSVEGMLSLFSEHSLNKLDRLDSDYINEHFGELQDEAYEEGKKVGIEEGKAIGYEQCAIDAQKVIHKIFNTHKGCLLGHEMDEIFGTRDCVYILLHHSIKEIISKIEAWEKAKQEIKVGDVVEVTGCKFKAIVVGKTSDLSVALLFGNGRTGGAPTKDCIKTGRTIDIASVLEQIGG